MDKKTMMTITSIFFVLLVAAKTALLLKGIDMSVVILSWIYFVYWVTWVVLYEYSSVYKNKMFFWFIAIFPVGFGAQWALLSELPWLAKGVIALVMGVVMISPVSKLSRELWEEEESAEEDYSEYGW